MTKAIEIHVGQPFDAISARVADAWHRAERGEAVDESHVTFASWDALARVMTGSRLELLRQIHRHPASDIAALAKQTGRHDEEVRADVNALSEAGLVETDSSGLRADYDEIRTVLAL